MGNSFAGVVINSASGTILGGTTAAARNVISGNSSNGILLVNPGSTVNMIRGNYVGTDRDGVSAVGNQTGITIWGSPNNTIGGTDLGMGNLISGNTSDGVKITNDPLEPGIVPDASGNLVHGNFIGTDVNGTADLGNTFSGVVIQNGASNNTIGGTSAGARNIVSGNDSAGLFISGSSTTGNLVRGNFIGTDVNGTADLGNSFDGVFIGSSASNNTIGGTTAGARNIISGNDSNGIRVDGPAQANFVQGNFIGTNVNGTADLGNTSHGVLINGANSNTIGGTTSGARNLISGNDVNGIRLTAGATTNLVRGNFIGTDVTGTIDLGNTSHGVLINGANSNTIGGTTSGARNLISGNDVNGIRLTAGATTNLVRGNFIGTDVTGTIDLGNTRHGVLIGNAPSNTIGGTSAGARNVISGNNIRGVYITGSSATANLVQGNFIGTDATGTADLGNSFAGVGIANGASNNTIGGTTAGARNLISGNDANGIGIVASNTTGNKVEGNFIGTKADGTTALGNNDHGVFVGNPIDIGAVDDLGSASDNFIGGTASGAGNTVLSNSIFSNGELGIDLGANGVTPNDVGDADTGPNNLQNFPEERVSEVGAGDGMLLGVHSGRQQLRRC